MMIQCFSKGDDDDDSSLIDEELLQKYLVEIRQLRSQGKSWKEVENIMDIWWPEDDERGASERFEARGRQGAKQLSDQEQVNEMIKLLYRRLAEDQERLDTHKGGPKETKYTIPIIKYVANLDESQLINLPDDD